MGLFKRIVTANLSSSFFFLNTFKDCCICKLVVNFQQCITSIHVIVLISQHTSKTKTSLNITCTYVEMFFFLLILFLCLYLFRFHTNHIVGAMSTLLKLTGTRQMIKINFLLVAYRKRQMYIIIKVLGIRYVPT